MEKSKSSEPSRCPCGFWGSPSTLGLCSTCYKAHVEKKSNEALKSTPDHMVPKTDTGIQMKTGSNGLNSAPPQASSSTDGSNIQSSASSSTEQHTTGSVNIFVHSSHQQSVCSDNTDSLNYQDSASSTMSTDKTSSSSSSQPSSSSVISNDKDSNIESCIKYNVTIEPSSGATTTADNVKPMVVEAAAADVDKRGIKRSHDVMEEETKTPESSPEKPTQKNKKRCNECKCKLELAQRQIGLCRCGYVYCALHRLPELHNCDFDHKEDGRREAREKMVKPKRHLGTSFKRIDSDS